MNTTITATVILTAEQLFRVIKSFPRVWFALSNASPAVCYEFPVSSEDVSLDLVNGASIIHTETDLEKEPSASIACDEYQCQVDFDGNDILSLIAASSPNHSQGVTPPISASPFRSTSNLGYTLLCNRNTIYTLKFRVDLRIIFNDFGQV